MKRITALMLTLVMCLSLVGCSGPDKQPAIDAFNKASTAFDEVASKINADPEAYAQDVFDTLNEMAEVMLQHKSILEGDAEVTEEKLNEMIAWYADVEEWVASVKADLEIE